MAWSLTTRYSPRAATVPGNEPRMLSRRKPYASFSVHAMSFTAAIETPGLGAAATIRVKLRPIRPRPLIPIATVIERSSTPLL